MREALAEKLDELSAFSFGEKLFRVTLERQVLERLSEMGVSGDLADRVAQGLRGLQKRLVGGVVNASFEASRQFSGRRYSFGFCAVYTACEVVTAIEEVRFWATKTWGKICDEEGIEGYYVLVSIGFDGVVKDLRGLVKEFPDLVHPSDYTLCQFAGAKLRKDGVGGLLARSARCDDGTCVPVFRVRCLTEGRVEERIVFRVGAASGELEVERARLS